MIPQEQPGPTVTAEDVRRSVAAFKQTYGHELDGIRASPRDSPTTNEWYELLLDLAEGNSAALVRAPAIIQRIIRETRAANDNERIRLVEANRAVASQGQAQASPGESRELAEFKKDEEQLMAMLDRKGDESSFAWYRETEKEHWLKFHEHIKSKLSATRTPEVAQDMRILDLRIKAFDDINAREELRGYSVKQGKDAIKRLETAIAGLQTQPAKTPEQTGTRPEWYDQELIRTPQRSAPQPTMQAATRDDEQPPRRELRGSDVVRMLE